MGSSSIANGTPIGALQSRMVTLEARRLALEAELAQAIAPAPRLHPNLPEVYRARLQQLVATLEADTADEARELIRSLVDSVLVHAEVKGFRIEVCGELANILSLAAGSPRKAEMMCEQIKVVAGVGFEPTTFRL